MFKAGAITMITYKKGDVIQAMIDGEIKGMAHGVNCSGGFGSGVAGQLTKKFPKARKEYLDCFNKGYWSLGMIDPVVTNSGIIYNCATQEQYGGKPYPARTGMYCSYDAIRNCLRTLERNSVAPLGIPRIGAGLAGGDWNVIKAIVEEVFGSSEKELIVYEY
jgi:O-acetyl-ADP-ribose deacetylase (regulator of RNase III)